MVDWNDLLIILQEMSQNVSILQELEERNITENATALLTEMIRHASAKSQTTEDTCKCEMPIVKEYVLNYHCYVAVAVCIFGTVANVFNIAVLTSKDMYPAPINKILTGLAVADILVMIEYVPFAFYRHVELRQRNFHYAAAFFTMFHTHFSQVLHTISICFTLTLAIWRYLAIG